MTQSTSGSAKQFHDFQWSKSGPEATETTPSWNTRLDTTFRRTVAGTYQITWSAQFYVVSGATTQCEIRFVKDGVRFGGAVTQEGDTNEQTATCIQYESYADGDQPVIQIQFRRQGTAGTAGVRRCTVAIIRVGD